MDQVMENDELGEAVNDFDHEGDIFVNEGDNLEYERDTTDNVGEEQQVDDLIDLQEQGDIAETEEDFDDVQFKDEAKSIDQFCFRTCLRRRHITSNMNPIRTIL